MNPSSSSISPSSSKRKRDDSNSYGKPDCTKAKNDVFMNYSFEDIGQSFISHLRRALSHNSITISDHTMLTVGQDMLLQLFKAIEESEIYVVVFSTNYASSVRCLDELVHIMDCLGKLEQRKVLPVFYKVDPSDVRSQQGSFIEAFLAYETNVDPERVENWKKALKDAGQLSGLTMQNGDEATFILEIIEEVEKMQSPQELHVTDHPVGIGSRAEELISKLRLDCENVLVVAVFGISGIGKTTIVKATYNKIAAKFDVSCFLGDIHYNCGGPNWKVDLPKLLLSCLTQNDKFSIMHRHNDRVTKIRRLISRRKILLVLDDVDNFQQLEGLGIDPAWFYKGSRIIVTTRDKQSLGTIPYISYHTILLNRRESLNLFTRLMFSRDTPVDTQFVKEVVARAGGLPLILKVWSRHFKQFEMEQWPSILETLKRIPHGDVQKQLQMSYDSLTNRSKKLFLDIACFFRGQEKHTVVEVLNNEDLAFYADNEIQYLVDKGLVELGSQVRMHHVIEEMGQEIVRQENEDEPGKRTRLRDDTDVLSILTECSGTESVESIRFEYAYKKKKEIVQLEAFRSMSNLRLMSFFGPGLSWAPFDDNMPPLSFKKLKYLNWDGFPMKSVNIDMGNVVVLRLEFSKLEILWEGFKSLKKLRILDLNGSFSLIKTGDFSGLENLEEMSFRACNKLEELDSSIGCLHKLVILNLADCTRLKRFPWEMLSKLRSLRKLFLSRCENIGLELEEVSVPFMSSLMKCSLKVLELSGCNVLEISVNVGSLRWLKQLDLSGNRFSSLPESIEQLHELKTILFNNCYNMHSIPNLPPNLKLIRATYCKNLVNLPSNVSDLNFLRELDLSECSLLGSTAHECFRKLTGMRSLCILKMKNCNVSEVPSEIGNMVSLTDLDLSGNTFSSLPDTFSNLLELHELQINHCTKLELLPLLPLKLTKIEAFKCCSLDVIPFDPTTAKYSLRTKVGKDSPFTKPLEIYLSGDEIPNWCNDRHNEDMLSFEAPTRLDKKILGFIIRATTQKHYHSSPYITPKILNKTNKKSHHFRRMCLESSISTCIIFYPLDDTTLVVEAGDTAVLQFRDKCVPKRVTSYGLSLVYEGDEMDSKLVIEPTRPILSELTTSMTELCDNSFESDDEVCSQ